MKSNDYKLIKNYIKILLENVTDDTTVGSTHIPPAEDEIQSLENKYQDEIQSKNKTHALQNKLNVYSGKSWDLLDIVIQKFKELDDPALYRNQDIVAHKTELLENVLKDSGFVKAGEGAFRKVWVNPNANFIVKIEKRIKSFKNWGQYDFLNTNKIEYDTYFDFGSPSQTRNALFPKIYSYDQTDKLWIIFEKVNTFKPTDTKVLQKIFAPFLLLCQKIIWVLEHEPALRTQSHELNYFAMHPDVLNAIEFPDTDPELFFNIIFGWTLRKLPEFYQTYGDFKKAFHELILQQLIAKVILNQNLIKKNPQKFQLLKNKLAQNLGGDFLPTPDFQYIGHFIKYGIDDLHIGNLGYRDLKNNSREPWKNFVILDFGGFGNPNP
jgi:hypothetical protein